MNDTITNDPDYYNELHAAGRHYDTKLWAIPGIFIVLQIGIFTKGLPNDYLGYGWFLSDIIFSILLFMQFRKDLFWQKMTQYKIDVLDSNHEDRIPLYAVVGGKKIIKMEDERRKCEAGARQDFAALDKWIVRQSLARWTSWIMFIVGILAPAIILVTAIVLKNNTSSIFN